VARRRLSFGTPFSYLAALLIAGVTAVPLLYTIVNGFRTNAQINAHPAGVPHPWEFGNYADVFSSSVFWRALGNSAFIAIIVTVLVLVCGSMAGYALSRYDFRGREGVYTLFTVGLLFPISAAALPLYLLLRQFGLLEHLIGVALPEAAFSLPVTIVILRPFMRAIPGEIEDAAVVDGTSRLGFFWRILLPLSRPALTTVGVLAFVTSWNYYLLPMLVLSDPNDFTLPLGVASFQTQFSQDTARILAYTAASMLPALGLFIFAERHIVGGLTGSIKG
jgi:raffinose/stachyose/melibiose transport system permease protein